MDKKQLSMQAKELHSLGYGCTQAVACVFSDITGVDKKTLFKLAEPFCLGMGDTQGCCGALTGGLMVLGLFNSAGDASHPTKKSSYELGLKLREGFEKKWGSQICADIRAEEPEKRRAMCDGYIQDVVERVCDIIGEKEA